MNTLKRITSTAIAAGIAVGVFAGSASAAVVSTALYLAIDSSGSIGSSGFALQRDAYVNLLGGISTDGSVSIGVLQFSSTISEEFALTQIASETDRDNLLAAISGMSWLNNNTNLSGAINTASAALTSTYDCGVIKCLIDVSTDGMQVGGDGPPGPAAAAAVAAGVDAVNCVGIGGGADCSFIAGAGSFSVFATDFTAFESALNTKLAREGVIPGGEIPLPAPALLLLTGLGGVFAFGRRKPTA